MKQTNGWSKSPHKHSSHRGGRRNNSGSYSLKYQRNNAHRNGRITFFDTIKERLNFTFKNLAGKEVKLKLSSGVVLTGILIASGHESSAGSKVTLQYCNIVSRPEGNKDVIPTGERKFVVQWNDMAYILGSDEKAIVPSVDRMKTDADITRSKIMAGKISGRQLQAADSSWLKKSSDVAKTDLTSHEKLGAWDQFKVNEEKFGVKGSFKEDLYTTNLDKSALTSEQIEKAKQTAREIEKKTSSNQHIREERNHKVLNEVDEESKYSAVQRAPQKEKSKTGAPLNFAAALMKGEPQPPVKSKDHFQTPTRNTLKHRFADTAGKKRESKTKNNEKKESRTNKYKVSDVDFTALKKATYFKKTLHTPISKNWDAHTFTKKKMEAGRGKTREEQINEFKRFSSSLDSKKEKTKKTLNVNAKEFTPPVVQYHQPVPPTAPEATKQTKTSESESKASAGQTTARQPANPMAASQNFMQQPSVWQMPIPPHMPMNFYHPVMLPPGAQVYPQSANGNMIVPGHPYVVHMIPPAGMHPYAQNQRVPAGFGQPPQVVQVAPGMQQGADLTDAQKQMMQMQAQQFQQAQQQQPRQQVETSSEPKG